MKKYEVVAKIWSRYAFLDEEELSEEFNMNVDSCDYIGMEWDEIRGVWIYGYKIVIKGETEYDIQLASEKSDLCHYIAECQS